jgi:hypothetical protein
MVVHTIQKQRQLTQIGKIRLGQKTRNAAGKEFPTKLDTLRFTSPRREHIETIAEHYGGEVRPWQPPHGNSQWEVITGVAEVPVLVPPQDPGESQWYEEWDRGGCKRRCDGITERISGDPCKCPTDPKQRKCKLHTRVTLMLAEVESAGVFMLDTSSFYAAVEMPGITRLLASSKGIIPGRFYLDQRSKMIEGKLHNYAVPVIDPVGFTAAELVSGRAPELAAQRLADQIEGKAPAAIASGPNVLQLVNEMDTLEELRILWRRLRSGGDLTEELKAAIEARSNKLAEAAEDDVVDAEIVEEPEGWEPQ